ncbi:MAG TPA: hypothetical protein VHQ04_00760 [Puia sp.]|jgi:hypothetical protein|nr:hypothetical protein [Puia sp.]
MEKLKEMELELLVTMRNNETTESNQFYKLFEYRWPQFQECLRFLDNKGLFIQADLQTMPGLKKYKLTKLGNDRVTQLLSERSHAVHVKLAHLRRSKNLESSQREHSLLGLFAFLTNFSSRFRRQVH